MARRKRSTNPKRVLIQALLFAMSLAAFSWALNQPLLPYVPYTLRPYLDYAWLVTGVLSALVVIPSFIRWRKFGRPVPFASSMFRRNQHLRKGEAGWVYILIHPEMPGLCKVGFTDRDPAERARELKCSETGRLPGMKPLVADFTVTWSQKSQFAHQVEQQAHRLLGSRRVNREREFFSGRPRDMIRAIRQAEGHVGQISREWR